MSDHRTSSSSGRGPDPRAESWAIQKRRVGFLVSTITTALFFALVAFMAFRPRLLAGFLPGSAIPVGLAAALAFLLFAFFAMAGFVLWRERREPEGPRR